MEQTLDVTLTLPVSVGPLPRGRVLGPLPLKNDLQPSTFKQCVTLSMQEAGKAIFLQERKGIHRECAFRPLSCSKCLASQMSDL